MCTLRCEVGSNLVKEHIRFKILHRTCLVLLDTPFEEGADGGQCKLHETPVQMDSEESGLFILLTPEDCLAITTE